MALIPRARDRAALPLGCWTALARRVAFLPGWRGKGPPHNAARARPSARARAYAREAQSHVRGARDRAWCT